METKNQIGTVEEFLQIQLSQISQMYTGKANCCRCGCKGKYTATSFMESPTTKVNDTAVKQQLTKAKRMIADGTFCKIDFGSTYIDIQYGEDRSITFYTDKIK